MNRPTHCHNSHGIPTPIPFTDGTIIAEEEIAFLIREDEGSYLPGVRYNYSVVYGLSLHENISLADAAKEFEESLSHQRKEKLNF